MWVFSKQVPARFSRYNRNQRWACWSGCQFILETPALLQLSLDEGIKRFCQYPHWFLQVLTWEITCTVLLRGHITWPLGWAKGDWTTEKLIQRVCNIHSTYKQSFKYLTLPIINSFLPMVKCSKVVAKKKKNYIKMSKSSTSPDFFPLVSA